MAAPIYLPKVSVPQVRPPDQSLLRAPDLTGGDALVQALRRQADPLSDGRASGAGVVSAIHATGHALGGEHVRVAADHLASAIRGSGMAQEKFMTEVAGKLVAANKATDRSAARTDYVKGMAELETKFTADPDYRNAPGKFAEEQAALESSLLGKFIDPSERAQLELDFARHGITVQNRVGRAALRREVDDNKTMYDARAQSYFDDAANAESPAHRATAVAGFERDTNEMVGAGWFPPAYGAERKQQFVSDVDTSDAKGAIAADAGAAVVGLHDPATYPGLTADARATLLDQAQAEERRQADVQGPVERAGFAQLADGTLTRTWLDSVADQIPGATYKRLAGALTPPPAVTQDHAGIYADLLDQAGDDPRGALMNAADAYRDGHITRAALGRVHSIAASFDEEIDRRPYALDHRRDLIDLLRPTDPTSIAQGRALHNAVTAYDSFLDDNIEADPAATHAEMMKIVAASRASLNAEERASLPLPKFAGSTRGDFDPEGLGLAAGRLRAAHDAFRLGDDDLVAQADLLRSWRALMDREGGQ